MFATIKASKMNRRRVRFIVCKFAASRVAKKRNEQRRKYLTPGFIEKKTPSPIVGDIVPHHPTGKQSYELFGVKKSVSLLRKLLH